MMDYPPGLPCWAPGAADYLASILIGDEVGWEWGGGQSTAWLAPKVSRLFVMEHNPKWIRMISRTAVNAVVFQRGHRSKDYVNWVSEFAKRTGVRPTLWLIDGYQRIDCLELVERKAKDGDIVVLDDALDYGEHLLAGENDIKRFAMPHPHAGKPCVSRKNTRDRNTVRKTAPATKETFVWRV